MPGTRYGSSHAAGFRRAAFRSGDLAILLFEVVSTTSPLWRIYSSTSPVEDILLK